MHLENFDLNLLVALDALLRRRSVTLAAEEMHVTQSAMSNALKRARHHFEDEILYYDGQQMVPTSFGQELAVWIPDMVTQLRALARMRSQSALGGLNRQFTVIASDYVSAVYLSRLTRVLADLAPQVALSVVPYTEETIGRFQRGVIDFLIGPDFALQTSYDARPLFTDRFKCVLWAENPTVRSGFSADAFFASPLVVTNFFLENGKSHFERWLAEQGREIKIAAALPSFVVLPHFVSGTRNIATIHNRLVPQFQSQTDLVFLDPPIAVPPLQEHLVVSDKHPYDKEAQLLVDVMLSVGKQMDQDT